LQISFLELEKKWLQDELLELHALVKDTLLQKAKFINVPVAKTDHKMPYNNLVLLVVTLLTTKHFMTIMLCCCRTRWASSL
jgi:hypothetical protein